MLKELSKVRRILFDYDNTLLLHKPTTESQVICDFLKIEKTERHEKDIHDYFLNCAKLMGHGKIRLERYKEATCRSLSFISNGLVTYDEWIEAMNYCSIHNSTVDLSTYEVLEYLCSKGYKLCIITNGFYDSQLQSMKNWRIDEYFDNIYAWDNEYPKPHRSFFYRALDGTEPYENAVVGDSLRADIAPANRLGIITFAFNVRKPMPKVKPKVLLSNLSEIKEYL